MINSSNQKHKKIKHRLQINTYDIDIAGHVNNIVYFKWYEDLRTNLFNRHFNLQTLLKENLYPVVVSTNIVYKKSLKLFDEPIGYMNLISFNHGIITLKVEIKLDEEVAAFGEQKCVLMDLIKGTMDKKKLKSLVNIQRIIKK